MYWNMKYDSYMGMRVLETAVVLITSLAAVNAAAQLTS